MIMKWLGAIFVAAVFAVLSFNAFIDNSLGGYHGNRFIAMMADLHGWLMATIGSAATGILFAVCAVGILVLAALPGGKKQA